MEPGVRASSFLGNKLVLVSSEAKGMHMCKEHVCLSKCGS